MTNGLAQIERARGFLEAAHLSEAWIRRMSERALLLEAHHTTHIEGTKLTSDQAEQLMVQFGRREPKEQQTAAPETVKGAEVEELD